MFTPEQKKIFKFPGLDVGYDPLDLKRKLTLATQGKLTDLIDLYNDGTELEQSQAEEDLVKAARVAFGFKPLAEKGSVFDATVLEYLAFFLEWLSRPSQPSISPYLTSRPCTDCPPPSTT